MTGLPTFGTIFGATRLTKWLISLLVFVAAPAESGLRKKLLKGALALGAVGLGRLSQVCINN